MKPTQTRIASLIGLAAVVALTAGGRREVAAQENEGRALEEIKVTARKREQSLRDVPLSITAVSGDKIENAGIDDLTDLSSFVPGLVISRGAVNTNIYIRRESIVQGIKSPVSCRYFGKGRGLYSVADNEKHLSRRIL